MAYNPDNYINGVDQRGIAEQRRDEDAAKKKLEAAYARLMAAQKKSQARQLDRIMSGSGGANNPKSPSPSDISNGKLRKKNK